MTVGKLATVDKYARPCRGVHGGQDYVGAVLSAAHYHARIRDNQCVELVDAHIPGVHLCQKRVESLAFGVKQVVLYLGEYGDCSHNRLLVKLGLFP